MLEYLSGKYFLLSFKQRALSPSKASIHFTTYQCNIYRLEETCQLATDSVKSLESCFQSISNEQALESVSSKHWKNCVF